MLIHAGIVDESGG